MGHGENNTKKKMNFKFNAEHTFFTSDTHFNHANIIKFCNRPFKDVEQMNEVIIANWNSVIGKDDTVFHLGDFCLGGATEWTKILDRLNGKIYLIMGNHDLKNIRQGFISRFEHVAMQMRIEIGKKRIYLCHYPFLCFEGGYKDESIPEGITQEMTRRGSSFSIRPSMMWEWTTMALLQCHLGK